MKILIVNTPFNTGSIGCTAEYIGKSVLGNGHQSFNAASFAKRPKAWLFI